MPRYIVLDSRKNIADNVAQKINVRLREAYANLGYTVDTVGVIGRASGVNQPTRQKTTGWAVPFQRLTDNKWCVVHPEAHPLFGVIVDNATGEKWEQFLLKDMSGAFSGYTVEESTPAWFPSSAIGG